MKKKLPAIILVLVISYTLIPFFHVTVSAPKKTYYIKDEVIFSLSNKSLFEGKISNIGWILEYKIDDKWIEVKGPPEHTLGLLMILPANTSKTHRITLKDLEPGDYRFGKDIKFFGIEIRRFFQFSLEKKIHQINLYS